MVAWVREHGPRTPTSFSNIEVERDLPAFWLEQGSTHRVADAEDAKAKASLDRG